MGPSIIFQEYLPCLKVTYAASSPSMEKCRVRGLVLAPAAPVLTAVAGMAALALKKFRDLDTYGTYIPKLG